MRMPYSAPAFLSAATLLGALAVLSANIAIAVEDTASTAWAVDNQQQLYASEGIALLVLDQAVGDVRIEGAEVDSVIVTMISQRHQDDPREPQVLEVREDAELRLNIGFAASELPEHEDWEKRRIDVGVKVPANLALSVQTTDGRIEIKKLNAAASLTTQTGAIEFDGSEALQAHSQQGSIRALVRSTQTDEPLTVESVNGDVLVNLLEGASATVKLQTKGMMISDYTIEIDRARGSRRKVGRAVIGDGRRSIRLSSENGSVRLANVIVEEQPQAQQ